MHRSPWFRANMGYPTTTAEMRTKLGLTAGTAAFTQTYSTADTTVSAPTATAVGDLVATEGTGWGASSEANFDKIGTAIDALIADNLNLRKVVTKLIDILQAAGMAT